jgi:serine/threonine protein kinase
VNNKEGYYPHQADIWALGVTLYYCVFGKPPFIGLNDMLTYQSIVNNELILEGESVNNIVLSEECKHFLTRILDKNPETRITMKEIRVCCSVSFFYVLFLFHTVVIILLKLAIILGNIYIFFFL